MSPRARSVAWLLAFALAGLVFGFLAGRGEVLGCADRMHEHDPRSVRTVCGSLWEVYQ